MLNGKPTGFGVRGISHVEMNAAHASAITKDL
jgi:hypothetical protein